MTLPPHPGTRPNGKHRTPRAASVPRVPSLTEQQVMREFTEEYQTQLRYNHDRGRWLLWGEHFWRLDGRKRAFFYAIDYCYRVGMKKAQTASFANAVESMARVMREVATNNSDWNPSVDRIACPGGVIELDSGTLRPGRPEDMLNRALTVTPDALCPGDTWFSFLDTMFAGDATIIDFLQRWCGYCLSGHIYEHKFLFLHGTGANGKGTLLNTLAEIWGDLVATASIDLFLEAQYDRHPTELARLDGVHLVQVHETREGKRWDEARLKALTGGDRITARFMRKDDFEFSPRFKPMFAGNHRPQLRTVDEAMRRRFLLLPCVVTIPPDRRDPKLIEKLRAEQPRILAWAVEGYRHWRLHGLKPPTAVVDATSDYLEMQNDFQLWYDERLVLDKKSQITNKALFADWKQWKDSRGESPGLARNLAEKLRDKGFTPRKTKYGLEFDGIALSYQSGA